MWVCDKGDGNLGLSPGFGNAARWGTTPSRDPAASEPPVTFIHTDRRRRRREIGERGAQVESTSLKRRPRRSTPYKCVCNKTGNPFFAPLLCKPTFSQSDWEKNPFPFVNLLSCAVADVGCGDRRGGRERREGESSAAAMRDKNLLSFTRRRQRQDTTKDDGSGAQVGLSLSPVSASPQFLMESQSYLHESWVGKGQKERC